MKFDLEGIHYEIPITPKDDMSRERQFALAALQEVNEENKLELIRTNKQRLEELLKQLNIIEKQIILKTK